MAGAIQERCAAWWSDTGAETIIDDISQLTEGVVFVGARILTGSGTIEAKGGGAIFAFDSVFPSPPTCTLNPLKE